MILRPVSPQSPCGPPVRKQPVGLTWQRIAVSPTSRGDSPGSNLADLDDSHIRCHINPTGCFLQGGPHGDCGVTGRKIIVDTYGGRGRHGGGAFSGKDPTKVDRSAAYAARHIAKNIVAAGLADRLELQISYAIGVARPLSLFVDTFGTGKVSDEEIIRLINEHFDLRPAGIIQALNLRRPIYQPTAAFGHFGRTDIDAPWEALDKVPMLRRGVGASFEKSDQTVNP